MNSDGVERRAGRVPFFVWVLLAAVGPLVVATIVSYFAGSPFGWGLTPQPFGFFAWMAVQATAQFGARVAIRWTALGPDSARLRIVAGPALAIAVWSAGWFAMGRPVSYGDWFLLAVIDTGTSLALWGVLALCGERDVREGTEPPSAKFGIVEVLLALAVLGALSAFGRFFAADARVLENPTNLLAVIPWTSLRSAMFFPLDASLRFSILGDTPRRRNVGWALTAGFASVLLAGALGLFPGIPIGAGYLVGFTLLLVAYDVALRFLGVRAARRRHSSAGQIADPRSETSASRSEESGATKLTL
jgi:hypothetical protein